MVDITTEQVAIIALAFVALVCVGGAIAAHADITSIMALLTSIVVIIAALAGYQYGYKQAMVEQGHAKCECK